MSEAIVVPARFNGPLDSGNGGYCGGLFAARVEGPAEVGLRSPVPLDTELRPEREGDVVRVLNGETLVAEARPAAPVEAAVPAGVGVEEARRAAGRYPAPSEGLFSRCYVCGPAREDCFRVFAGETDDGSMVASPWTPPEWAAGGDGLVRAEHVWAALDCPTYWAAHIGAEMSMSFLVGQGVTVHAPIPAGIEHVVVAWPLGAEGRKRRAGAALLSADGEVLASGRALLVEARTE